jgi:hypothetical protein
LVQIFERTPVYPGRELGRLLVALDERSLDFLLVCKNEKWG